MVRGYTLAQVRAYLEAIDRARNRELYEFCITTRAAAKYDNKNFTKYLKTLSDGQ